MTALVAGFGNIFHSDDGFGSAVIRELADVDLGPHARVRDFGTGGMHLAMEMLGPYDRVIIVDAIGREEPAGTVFAIDCTHECPLEQSAPDAHAMTVGSVFALYERMRAQLGPDHEPAIMVIGCVPQNLGEGMELSDPVRAAIPACIDLIRTFARQGAARKAQP